MNNILEDLYYCKIRPCDTPRPQSQKYEKLMETASNLSEAFLEKLDNLEPSLRREYVALTDAQTAATLYEYYQNFEIGFRLGVKLAIAVYTKN